MPQIQAAECSARFHKPPMLLLLTAAVIVVYWISPVVCRADPAGKPSLVYVESSQDDLLLMAVQIDSVVLNQNVDSYLHPGGIFLPFGEMCKLLELGITVAPETGSASGFIISPNRTFSLDLLRKQVTIQGKTLTYNPDLVQLHKNDIYVDSKLISQWLPLDMEISKNDAMVRVHPREVLPMQMRMERERHNLQAASFVSPTDSGFEKVKSSYKMLAVPSLDQRVTVSLSPSGTGKSTALQYSSIASGDLLGMGATAMVFNDSGSHSLQSRLTLSRFDPDAGLLGGFGARELSFGDIYSPAHPLLTRPTPGRGIVVSSYPLNQQDQFDTHTFQGSIPPGWDVELYRNDALIDYRPASDNGRYEFSNVPLLFGLNDFKLIFFGPQGQRRQEEHRFNVGSSLISRGQYYYRFAMNKQEDGGSQLMWQNDYGLLSGLSLNTTLSRFRVDNKDYNSTSVGLRGCAGGFFVQSDMAFQNTGGYANETGLQTTLGNMSISLKHTTMSNFVSDVYRPDVDALTSRTILRVDGIRMPRRFHVLPMTLQVSKERYASGNEATHISNQISTSFQGLRLSHYTDYERDTGPDGTQRLFGSRTLVASKRFRTLEIRGEAQYNIGPGGRPTDLLLNFEKSLPGERMLNLTLQRSASTGIISAIATYDRYQGSFGNGISGRYDSNGTVFAGFNIYVGVGREPREGTVFTDARTVAESGGASLRAFLDTNQNGKFDPGEKLLQGIKFAVNQQVARTQTDSKGIAVITGLQNYQPADVSIVETSIEDPLWVPEKKGIRFVPRPGNVVAIDLPVVATGEITGTVRITQNNSLHEYAGMKLELINAENRVVMTTKSEYDGFYTLSRVPAGKYRLRLYSQQALAADLEAAPRELVIAPMGSYIDGIDIALKPSKSVQKVQLASTKAPITVPQVVKKTAPPSMATFKALVSKRGGQVTWYPEQKTVLATVHGKMVVILLGQNTMTIRGVSRKLSQAPRIVNGKLWLAAEDVALALAELR